MNPLQFLPQDLEDIIINYKEELERKEHKKSFNKTLDIININEIYNTLNTDDIVTETAIQKDVMIISEQADVTLKKAFKSYLKHHLDVINAIIEFQDLYI